MAETCCGVLRDGEVSGPCEPSARAARRRRIEIRRFRTVADVASPADAFSFKRQKIGGPLSPASPPAGQIEKAFETPSARDELIRDVAGCGAAESEENPDLKSEPVQLVLSDRCPKYGSTSVCGRRRDMEDAVSIHPSFYGQDRRTGSRLHFFGVFDGHGCSHVIEISVFCEF